MVLPSSCAAEDTDSTSCRCCPFGIHIDYEFLKNCSHASHNSVLGSEAVQLERHGFADVIDNVPNLELSMRDSVISDGSSEVFLSTVGSLPSDMVDPAQRNIMDELAATLFRLQELEFQVKSIPYLQVQISVLKEEKRVLLDGAAASGTVVSTNNSSCSLKTLPNNIPPHTRDIGISCNIKCNSCVQKSRRNFVSLGTMTNFNDTVFAAVSSRCLEEPVMTWSEVSTNTDESCFGSRIAVPVAQLTPFWASELSDEKSDEGANYSLGRLSFPNGSAELGSSDSFQTEVSLLNTAVQTEYYKRDATAQTFAPRCQQKQTSAIDLRALSEVSSQCCLPTATFSSNTEPVILQNCGTQLSTSRLSVSMNTDISSISDSFTNTDPPTSLSVAVGSDSSPVLVDNATSLSDLTTDFTCIVQPIVDCSSAQTYQPRCIDKGCDVAITSCTKSTAVDVPTIFIASSVSCQTDSVNQQGTSVSPIIDDHLSVSAAEFGSPTKLKASTSIQVSSPSRDFAVQCTFDTEQITVATQVASKCIHEAGIDSAASLENSSLVSCSAASKLVNVQFPVASSDQSVSTVGSFTVENPLYHTKHVTLSDGDGLVSANQSFSVSNEAAFYDETAACKNCKCPKVSDVEVDQTKMPGFEGTLVALDSSLPVSSSGSSANTSSVFVDDNLSTIGQQYYDQNHGEDCFQSMSTQTDSEISVSVIVKLPTKETGVQTMSNRQWSFKSNSLKSGMKRTPSVASMDSVCSDLYPITETRVALADTELLQLRSLQLRLLNSKGNVKVPELIANKWIAMSKDPKHKPEELMGYITAITTFAGFVSCSAVVNHVDEFSNSALHYYVSCGNYACAQVLINMEVVKCDSVNSAGFSVVMMSAINKVTETCDEAVLRLLFSKSRLNLVSGKDGHSALMIAVLRDNISVIELLCEAGADLNIQDPDSYTALMLAAETGNEEVVDLLINESSCNVSLCNAQGENAVAIALANNFKPLAMKIYKRSAADRGSAPTTPIPSRRKSSSTYQL